MFRFVKKLFRVSTEDELPSDSESQPLVTADSGQNHLSLSEQGAVNLASPTNSGECVELPLSAIFKVLSPDLQARLRQNQTEGVSIAIPLPLVLGQLGRGSVKVTFGELRQMTPEGVFYSQSDRDQAVVELPLAEILMRIDPLHLPRRAQQCVSVPEQITSPFDARGNGLHIYKPEATPGTTFVRKIQDSPAVPEFPVRGNLPSAPPTFQPAPLSAVNQPEASVKEARPATSLLVQAAALPGSDAGAPLVIALEQLAGAWPEIIRQEILAHKLGDASVNLPLAFAEECLRKGKAVSSWKQIRVWMGTVAGNYVSSHDAELMELPLNVLAPLYLTRLRDNHAPKKVQVDKSIPDLFSHAGKTEPMVRPAVTPVPPPVVPAAPVQVPIAPQPYFAEGRGKARQSGPDQYLRSGTEFIRRSATPNDIVAKAGGVEGVEGALITLADGLLVASHLPGNVNGDTLAAFVPQLVSRVSQSAREFRMGELTQLGFTVGSTPWCVFKVGSIFFAAFGRAGHELPMDQLKAIAGELDRKKQNQ